MSFFTFPSKVEPVDELKSLTVMGKQQMLWGRERHLERKYVLVHGVRCRFVVESTTSHMGLLKIHKKLRREYCHYIPMIARC